MKLIEIILAVLIGLVLLFLVLRELFTWYWKINERVKLKKQEIALLTEILNELRGNTKEDSTKEKLLTESTEKENL